MNKAKVSLIVCAYNEENYIVDCLNSAISNSEGVFDEVLVVDNKSTDKTNVLVRNISGVRIVVEDKKGPTFARQRGYEEAIGDILVFIDADTRMPPGWAKKVIQEFEADSRLVCLSGPYRYFDVPTWQKAFVQMYWYSVYPVYLIVGYMAVGGNFAIKRETLNKMGGFDKSIEFYGDDTDLARRASKFGKVKFDLKLIMDTSGRRLAGQGFFSTGFMYVSNFLSEVFFKKPVTKGYKDIR